MISSFTAKIKNYFNIGKHSDEKNSKNKTIKSDDKIKKLKENFLEHCNQISNNTHNNKTINYLKLNNTFPSTSYYDDNTKNLIKENNNLFIEINQLKKDIDIYKDRIEELDNEYNNIKQEYRDNCLKNITHEKINIEKCFETDFIKLEEEKYNLKLNHLLDINNILLEENQKALKHNKQMKNLYKIYIGKNWKNSE